MPNPFDIKLDKNPFEIDIEDEYSVVEREFEKKYEVPLTVKQYEKQDVTKPKGEMFKAVPVTETEKIGESLAQAKKVDLYQTIINDQMSDIDGQLEKLKTEREDIRKQMTSSMGFNNPEFGYVVDKEAEKIQDSLNSKDAKIKNIERTKEILDLSNRFIETKDAGILKTMRSKLDKDFLTIGISNIERDFDMIGIAKRFQKDPNSVTDEEMQAITAYGILSDLRENVDTSIGHDVGESIMESIPFMAQFLIGTPFTAGGKAVGTKMLKAGANKFVSKATAAAIASILRLSALTPAIIENVENRMIGNIDLSLEGGKTTIKEDDTLEITQPKLTPKIREGSQAGLAEAVTKGGLQTYISVVAEGLGTYAAPVKGYLTKKLAGQGVNNFLKKTAQTPTGRLMKAANMNDLLSENAEEYFEKYADKVFLGEGEWGVTRDEALTIGLSTLLMRGIPQSVAMIQTGAKEIGRIKEEKNKAEQELFTKTRMEVDKIIDQDAPIEEIGKQLDDYIGVRIDEGADKKAVEKIVKYAGTKVKLNTFNEFLNIKDKEDQKIQEETENANEVKSTETVSMGEQTEVSEGVRGQDTGGQEVTGEVKETEPVQEEITEPVGKETEKPAGVTEREQPVSVPLTITKESKQQLADLGYQKKDISAMKPEQAQEVIKNQTVKPKETYTELESQLNEINTSIETLKTENVNQFKKDGTPKAKSKILPVYKALVDNKSSIAEKMQGLQEKEFVERGKVEKEQSRIETEKINQAFTERQTELEKNIPESELQEQKEFDEVNRIFDKVSNEEVPTPEEIDYVNEKSYLPKGFQFGKTGLEKIPEIKQKKQSDQPSVALETKPSEPAASETVQEKINYISKNTGVKFTKSKNTNSWYGSINDKAIRISDHPSKFTDRGKEQGIPAIDLNLEYYHPDAITHLINETDPFKNYKKGDKIIHSYNKIGEVTYLDSDYKKGYVEVETVDGKIVKYDIDKFLGKDYNEQPKPTTEVKGTDGTAQKTGTEETQKPEPETKQKIVEAIDNELKKTRKEKLSEKEEKIKNEMAEALERLLTKRVTGEESNRIKDILTVVKNAGELGIIQIEKGIDHVIEKLKNLLPGEDIEQYRTALSDYVKKNEKSKEERVSGIRKDLFDETDTKAERRTMEESLERGKEYLKKEVKNVDVYIQDIINDPRPLSADEVAAMVYYKTSLDNEFDKTYDNMVEAKDPVSKRILRGELEALQIKKNMYSDMAVYTRYENSLALNMYKLLLNSEFNISSMMKRYAAQNNGKVPAFIEEKIKGYQDEIDALKKQMRDLENNKLDNEAKQAINDIFNDIQKHGTKRTTPEALREIAANVRKGKLKPMGSFTGVIIPLEVWNIPLETIAKTLEVTASVIEAVQKALTEIKKSKWYKGLTKEQQKTFDKEYVKDLTEQLQELKTPYVKDKKLKIPGSIIRDYVASGKIEINDLVSAIKEDFELEQPEREIRDAITGYAKEINPKPDEIREKMREINRIGRLMSAIEDAKEGIKKAKNKTKKYRIEEKEKDLQHQLKEALKKVPETEQEQVQRIEETRDRLSSQIEKLKTKIEKAEKGITETEIEKPTKSYPPDIKQMIDERKNLVKQLAGIDSERKKRYKDMQVRTIADYHRKLGEVQKGTYKKPEQNIPDFDKEMRSLQIAKERVKYKFDEELEKARLANRTAGEIAGDVAVGLWNLPKSLRASWDLSALFNQGFGVTFAHPKMAIKAAGDMMRKAFHNKEFEDWLIDLELTPEYRLMKQSDLYIGRPNAKMSAKEDMFMYNISHYVPLLGKSYRNKKGKVVFPGLGLFQASERAYVHFLNKMRVDVFNFYAQPFLDAGMTFKSDPEVFKGIASYVNNSTGRGTVHKKIEPFMQGANNILFSPRFVASRFNLLNPAYYYKLPKEIAWKVAFDAVKTYGTGMAFLMLGQLAGADDTEWDIRSTDFGKIRFGDLRLDVWGGYQQTARFLGQMIRSARKDVNTGTIQRFRDESFNNPNWWTTTGSFISGKFSPSMALLQDLAMGKQVWGEDVDYDDRAFNLALPLLYNNIREIVNYSEEKDNLGYTGTLPLAVGGMRVDVQARSETDKLLEPIVSKMDKRLPFIVQEGYVANELIKKIYPQAKKFERDTHGNIIMTDEPKENLDLYRSELKAKKDFDKAMQRARLIFLRDQDTEFRKDAQKMVTGTINNRIENLEKYEEKHGKEKTKEFIYFLYTGHFVSKELGTQISIRFPYINEQTETKVEDNSYENE